MASILKVDTLQDQDGNNIISESANVITIGASGDTITIPSGASMSGFNSTGIDDNATSTAITIDSSENVGIGTTSPAEKLQIHETGSGSSFIQLTNLDTGSNDNKGLYLGVISGGNSYIGNRHSGDDIIFQNDNTEVMRIKTGGNVGIGTSSPETKLHVLSASSGASAHVNADDLFIENSSACGITIGSGATSVGAIYFADSSAQYDGYIEYNQNSRYMRFATAVSEAMRINSFGSVGIGTSSPGTVPLNVVSTDGGNVDEILELRNNSTTAGTGVRLRLVTSTDSGSTNNSVGISSYRNASNDIDLIFETVNSERMRIDSSGLVGINTSSPSALLDLAGKFSDTVNTNLSIEMGNRWGFRVGTSANDEPLHLDRNLSGTPAVCMTWDKNNGNVFVNNTSEPGNGDNGAMIGATTYHKFCRNSTASVFRVFPSSGEFRIIGGGNAQNTNNSYGAISDRELKENEVDANSQWNDIKALQIKNYNLKEFPNVKHLGVIAQDLEASGMNGVVEQNEDELYTEEDVLPDGKNIGDVKEKGYKTVKYSILYMKAVKALQEAMERIETLETKVQTLENNNP